MTTLIRNPPKHATIAYNTKLVFTALCHTNTFPVMAREVRKMVTELFAVDIHTSSISSSLKDLAMWGYIRRRKVYHDRALYEYEPTELFNFTKEPEV